MRHVRPCVKRPGKLYNCPKVAFKRPRNFFKEWVEAKANCLPVKTRIKEGEEKNEKKAGGNRW